jgi:tripartite-type tricarboxylate transporter receptor subunit TctC
LSGEVQAVFGSMPALLQNAKAGKVRPIAVGTTTRSPALPDVPTVAEQGYPGFNAALWLGIMGPAGMPRPVVDRLHKELLAVVATDEFRKAMDANGAEPVSSPTPEDFARMLSGEVERYTQLVQGLGIRLD